MTPELIAILGVGVALAAFGVTGLQLLFKQFERLDARIDRVDTRLDRLEGRVAALEQGQARLEGLLDGLREAIFERATR